MLILSIYRFLFSPQHRKIKFLWSSKKNENNGEHTCFNQSHAPRVSFSTVNQILEALRLQRRCQGNMVMVPLELHAAACWEKD